MWHEEDYLSVEDYIVKREGFFPFLFLFLGWISKLT